MNKVAGSRLTEKELLQYCIAFMNSTYAQQRLVTGHRPTPKGSFAITEAYMREVPIPAASSKKTVKRIIELVNGLDLKVFKLTEEGEVKRTEERLQELVDEALAASPA